MKSNLIGWPTFSTSPAASHWWTGVCFALSRLPPLRVFINKPHFSPAGAAARSSCQPASIVGLQLLFLTKAVEELLKSGFRFKRGTRVNVLRCNDQRLSVFYCPSRQRVVDCWTEPTCRPHTYLLWSAVSHIGPPCRLWKASVLSGESADTGEYPAMRIRAAVSCCVLWAS